MKKAKQQLQFKAGNDLEFFSTLRKRVDAYFESTGKDRHANAAMITKTIVLMFFYLAPLPLILIFEPSFPLTLLLWSIMGTALAGIGMSVMHDANHGAYSASDRVNRIVGLSLNLLGGTVVNWKVQHNMLHHTYTNVSGWDEDIDNKVIMRFSPHAEHKPVQKHQWWFAFLFYSIMTLYWGLLKDLVQLIGYKKKGYHRQKPKQLFWLYVRISLMKIAYFAIVLGLPLILTSIPWYQTVIGFVLMHVLAGTILSVVFQLAHTVDGTDFPLPDDNGSFEHAWAAHQLMTTSNFSRNNKLLSWYVGGLNFQVEHHLFPGICHVHYPAISNIVKETALEYGLPYHEQATFMEAFRSHVRLLKSLGVPSLSEIA